MSKARQILSAVNELVHLPIPLLSNEENAWVKALCNEPDLQKKIPLQTVKVEDLQPTQWRVDQSNINRLAKEGIFNGALVLKRRGALWIRDGHHRALAAKKEGRETNRSRVIEMKDDEPMTLKQFCRKFGLEEHQVIAAMDSGDRIQFEKQP